MNQYTILIFVLLCYISKLRISSFFNTNAVLLHRYRYMFVLLTAAI